MKRNLINSIIMAGLLAAAVSCQQSPSSDGALNPVTCKAGTFAGKVENGVTKFFGIRFAEDPMDHMFEPPVPYVYPEGIHQVTEYANACPQPDGYHLADVSGEDFLALNIWTVDNGMKKKPVMVYVHGGAWKVGGTREDLYDGSVFVKEYPEVMYVTLPYRLGVLGACDLDMFPDGDRYRQSKALCVLDLVCGLHWVRDNIAAFGGDPDNAPAQARACQADVAARAQFLPGSRAWRRHNATRKITHSKLFL